MDFYDINEHAMSQLITRANALEDEATVLWRELKAVEEETKPAMDKLNEARSKWCRAFEQAKALGAIISERQKGNL